MHLHFHNFSTPTFESHVLHYSDHPLGPRLVESPNSRMVVACAPWAEWQTLAHNIRGMKCAAYVLAGASYPEGVVERVYIGETNNWPRRCGEHDRDATKDFTSQLFLMGSFDPKFDKVDALMLQYKLNDRAEQLDRASIVRGAKPPMQRADRMRTQASQADFENVQRLLPTVGCAILEPRDGCPVVSRNGYDRAPGFLRRDVRQSRQRDDAERTIRNRGEEENCDRVAPTAGGLPAGPRADRERHQAPAIFVLEHAGLIAYGYQHGAEFVVLPGSHMRREVMPSFAADQQNLQRRNDLIQAHAISDVRGFDDRWRLKFERRLPSASIAAKVLMGVNLKADAWRPVGPDPRAV